MTNIVIDGGYEEAADGGQGPGAGADEVCPVLLGGGVASLGEAAADPEPLGTASVSHPALGGALVTCKAGAWENNINDLNFRMQFLIYTLYTSPPVPLEVVHSVFENVIILNRENGLRNRVSRGL